MILLGFGLGSLFGLLLAIRLRMHVEMKHRADLLSDADLALLADWARRIRAGGGPTVEEFREFTGRPS